MKKIIAGIMGVLLVLLFVGSSVFIAPSGKTVQASIHTPKFYINGVDVYSPINKVIHGDLYVDSEAFATVFKQKIMRSSDMKGYTLLGKPIEVKGFDDFKLVKAYDIYTILTQEYTTMWTKQDDGSYYLLVLPKGTIKLGGVVPMMGEHWMNPQTDVIMGDSGNVVFKSIYGVYKGKLVFLEEMISQKDFVDGNSYMGMDGMKGLPSPAVDHTDLGFEPNGHEGFPIPHFDIHHYFISKDDQAEIK